MKQNKTGKYLKYAIGEVVLVVIGILIALSLNNWNENRKHEKIELQLLTSLRNDVAGDIELLEEEDSIYSVIESNAEKAITLFYKAQSAKDFIEIEALNYERWTYLIINKSAFNEILNTGNLYTIKNKELKNLISEYYLDVDKYQPQVLATIEAQHKLITFNSDLYSSHMMKKQLENPQVALELIDTSWINNPKSATYLALNRYLQDNLNMYLRVKLYSTKSLLISAKRLKKELTKELEQNN